MTAAHLVDPDDTAGGNTIDADTSGANTGVDAVAVVVPARNEEELVLRALHALARAARHAHNTLGDRAPHIEIVLVADDCHDATARLARDVAGVTVTEITSASVGAARAAGVELALRKLRSAHRFSPERIWIANTDADSAVPVNWITDQLALAAAGTDAVIGTVRPDFADLTADQITHWTTTHTAGRPNGHVHGANLGVRASFYLAAGGFAPLPEHEDVDLVDRLVLQGARLLAADSSEVLTSGRLHGRTPSGYAGFLRTSLVDPGHSTGDLPGLSPGVDGPVLVP